MVRFLRLRLGPRGYIRKRIILVRIRHWEGYGDPYPDYQTWEKGEYEVPFPE